MATRASSDMKEERRGIQCFFILAIKRNCFCGNNTSILGASKPAFLSFNLIPSSCILTKTSSASSLGADLAHHTNPSKGLQYCC